MPKLGVYMPIAKNLPMFKFATDMLIRNSGLEYGKDWIFVAVVDDHTSREVREYINEKGFDYHEIQNGDKYTNWQAKHVNLWNEGYDAVFAKGCDYCVPTGSDHAFAPNFLKNLLKYAQPNRVVSCKLIEPGTIPTYHEAKNFGVVGKDFDEEAFLTFATSIFNVDALLTKESEYTRHALRWFDAMPFIMPKDVWQRFGPMNTFIDDQGWTHDTNLFIRMRKGGVELCKSLGAISYHMGSGEGGYATREKI